MLKQELGFHANIMPMPSLKSNYFPVLIGLLLVLAGFGLGYLTASSGDRSPIVIEKHSNLATP